jgi:hypothetical protein
VSIKTQPITVNSKRNGSAGQLKITGNGSKNSSSYLIFLKLLFPFADFLKEKKRPTVTAKKKQ